LSKEIVLRDGDVAGVPAAQYIRMSTEHQRYSPDNQRAAIAVYALERGFSVVETYQDSGKSGLSLSGRTELKRLLADVLSGSAKYQAILVLDVSRWGRFQDTDQAAHYEYLCRSAGIPVHYCAEPFDSEGGTVASIVKHMKRVMAAEYSRELSGRISRAQRHLAGFGFKQGGGQPYGLRRQVVDENGEPRFILGWGEHKALSTDRVIFVHGPERETGIVAAVFEKFVRKRMLLGEIAKWLNEAGEKQPNGNPWRTQPVRTMLRNQLYIGYYVFGTTKSNMGRKTRAPGSNVSRVRVIEPIVSEKLFAAAQRRLAYDPRRKWSDDEIRTGLLKLLDREGRLSYDLIEVCPYLPRASTVAYRYGSLTKAFEAIGIGGSSRCKRNAVGQPYSDEELLAELRRIYEERGYISRHAIDMDESSPSGRFYIRRFGGLLPAFQLAGFDVDASSQRNAARIRRHAVAGANGLPKQRPPVRGVSDADIMSGLKRLLDEHGYLSTQLVDNEPSLPSVGAISRRFGGMQGLYKKLGYAESFSEIIRAARVRRGLPLLAVPRVTKRKRPRKVQIV